MRRATLARNIPLAALLIYAACAAADSGLHLARKPLPGVARYAPGRVIVAADAGLFWPLDLVAAALLAHG